MNKELTNHLLDMYVSKDGRDERIKHFMPLVWNEREYCTATDAYRFIMIPANDDNRIPSPSCETVDISKILPAFDVNYPVDVDHLRAVYNKIPLVKETITEECDSCDGDGYFYHYGHRYDCENCDGTGEITKGSDRMVKSPDSFMGFFGFYFKPKFICELIEVFELSKASKLTILHISFHCPVFAMDNGIYVGIMPHIATSDDCPVYVMGTEQDKARFEQLTGLTVEA